MEKRFRSKLDKRSKRITWGLFAVIALVAGFFFWYYIGSGAYLSAWFLTLVGAVAALYILSIPRTVRVNKDAIEIHCILELTRIAAEDIYSVRRIENRDTGLWLLLGSYGFFGYYGYYLDWRQWQIVRMYACSWDNFVEITDIYEQRIIVSSDDPQALIEAAERLWYKNRDGAAKHPPTPAK